MLQHKEHLAEFSHLMKRPVYLHETNKKQEQLP